MRVKVIKRQCQHTGCEIKATFNFDWNKSAKFCRKHMQKGMVDVHSKRCRTKGCIKQACYGYEKGVFLYCVNCATEDMFDLKNKTCLHPDCDKYPSYNYPHLKKYLYCSKHKKKGMINICTKKCIYEDEEGRCTKCPAYNYAGEKKKLYCFAHRKEGMVDVANRICDIDGCSSRVRNPIKKKMLNGKYYCNKHFKLLENEKISEK